VQNQGEDIHWAPAQQYEEEGMEINSLEGNRYLIYQTTYLKEDGGN
jgi:hypothetical protein